MAERASDEALAQHLLKAGFVTEAELREAMRLRAERASEGHPRTLGEILVEKGLLSPSQLEKAEKKLHAQRESSSRLGPYRLLRKLGEGGMGEVYLAEDSRTGGRVAVKVLPKAAAQDEEMVRRFRREVDSARTLDHPNIVRAHESGVDRGYHYYVMEFVEGETVGTRLKREGALPPLEATRLILQVARGLHYAHGRGFVHRDVKPDNIIVSKDGTAKILDMGLSKNIAEAQTFLTVTGMALGTPHYMAPEQARGDKNIDGRADIYSLGATYYHLVTGQTPFRGSSAVELLGQHLNQQVPDPRDVRDGIPEGVVHVLRKMMAKSPEDRYRDGGELIADLERVLEGAEPVSRAVEATRSAVGMPLPGELRRRFRARLRHESAARPAASVRKGSRFRVPIAFGAAAVAAAILAIGAFGRRSAPDPVSRAPSRPETPALQAPASPEQAPAAEVSRPPLPAEARSEEAPRKPDGVAVLPDRPRVPKNEGESPRPPESSPPPPPAPPAVEPAPKAGVPAPPPAPVPAAPDPVERPAAAPAASPPEAPPAGVASAGPARRKRPIPESGRLREVTEALRRSFAVDAARTGADKGALARKLLEKARASETSEAELYGLLSLARALAVQAHDVRTALEALDLLAGAFEVKELEEKSELLLKTPVRAGEAASWAAAALEVADQAIEEEDYETALRLAARAETLARGVGDKETLEEARRRAREAADLRRMAEGVRSYVRTLERKPEDASAGAAVGKFLCLARGEWVRGLALLLRSPDPAWRALAEGEREAPTDPARRVALAEAWAAQAEKETPSYKIRARGRAAEWLERAIPQLTGPARTAAERKLAALGSEVRPRAGRILDLGDGLRLELVTLRPGVFMMGSADLLPEPWSRDERPSHRVELTREFQLARYELTRGAFEAFVRATGYGTETEKVGRLGIRRAQEGWGWAEGLSWRNLNFLQTDDHPVVGISWNDAVAFCEWATRRSGRWVRLPTEAEWEYACRAGTATRWSFGDEEAEMDRHGWYIANAGWATHPVGRKRPNPWGLYDMHGNVWEWCQDWWGPYGGDARDPQGPLQGRERVLRGGCWDNEARHCRSTLRHAIPPSQAFTTVGFRIAVR
ncbi:MAG TPA: SUMF1/EgtB/PvdO family nonheme iron enzyme [Planctomycetota bacterium]|nr:SUMF1/EgtB/PvdO family nonheme iron enzyme [Planctomycetota bacterium]